MMQPPLRSLRRGYTLMEMLAAMTMLGVLLATVGQLGVLGVTFQRRSAAQREASQAASNLLERLTALDYADLTPDRVAEEAKSAATDHLSLTAAVEELTGDERSLVRTRELVISVEHARVAGVRARLIGWKQAAERSTP